MRVRLWKFLRLYELLRAGTGIGTFSDRTRDGIRGSTVPAHQLDYFGQQAGYTMDPQEYISYAAVHDNETLFDTTQLKADQGTTTMAERLRIQIPGLIVMSIADDHGDIDLTNEANQISAFINQVEAFVAEAVLSPEEGEMLIAIAEAILLSLG